MGALTFSRLRISATFIIGSGLTEVAAPSPQAVSVGVGGRFDNLVIAVTKPCYTASRQTHHGPSLLDSLCRLNVLPAVPESGLALALYRLL
jgi:hypothetical protein